MITNIPEEETMKTLNEEKFKLEVLMDRIDNCLSPKGQGKLRKEIYKEKELSYYEKQMLWDMSKSRQAKVQAMIDSGEIEDPRIAEAEERAQAIVDTNKNVKAMQDEYSSWMEANEHLLEVEDKPVLYIEKTPVYDDKLNFIGTRFRPVDWQEEEESIENDLEAIKKCFTDGENINLWTGARRASVPIKREESEMGFVPTQINLKGAVEKYGSLEMVSKKFNDGITCGTSFTDIWRDSAFETGINPDQSYDSELDAWGNEDQLKAIAKNEELIAKELAKKTEKDILIGMDLGRINTIKEEVLPVIEARIRELVTEYKTVAEFHKAVFDDKVLFEVMSECMKEIRVKLHGEVEEEISNILEQDCFGKLYPYDYKEIQVKEGDDVDKLLSEAKTHNQLFCAEVFQIAKAVAKDSYNEVTPSREAFFKVQGMLAVLIMDHGKEKAYLKLKTENLLSKSEVYLAYGHAQNSLTAEYFTKDEFIMLKSAGLLPKPKARRKVKKDVVISKEIMQVIEDLKAGNKKSLNLQNAKAVQEACIDLRNSTGEQPLEKKSYAMVRDIAKMAA